MHISPIHSLTSALLILLLGKYWENWNVRPASVISSSHTFLPRSSNKGREQKSSSHSSTVGTLLPLLLGAASPSSATLVLLAQLHTQLDPRAAV